MTTRATSLRLLPCLTLLAAACGPVSSFRGPEFDASMAQLEASIVNGVRDPIRGVGTVVHHSTTVGATCTGTFIAPRTVLTAAHCLVQDDGSQAAPYDLFFYISDLPFSVDVMAEGPGMPNRSPLIPVRAAFVHPDYLDQEAAAAERIDVLIGGHETEVALTRRDIAVLHLLWPSTEPTHALSRATPSTGMGITLAGQGRVGEAEDGSGIVRTTANTIDWVGSDGFYYMGATGDEGTTCYGDSGGPAFGEDGTVIGVHSLSTCDATVEVAWWGFTEEMDASFAYDARVNRVVEWIDAHTATEPLPEPAIDLVSAPTDVSDPALLADLLVVLAFDAPAGLRSLSVEIDGRPMYGFAFPWNEWIEDNPLTVSLNPERSQPGPFELCAEASDFAWRQTRQCFRVPRENPNASLLDEELNGMPAIESSAGCSATPARAPALAILSGLFWVILRRGRRN